MPPQGPSSSTDRELRHRRPKPARPATKRKKPSPPASERTHEHDEQHAQDASSTGTHALPPPSAATRPPVPQPRPVPAPSAAAAAAGSVPAAAPRLKPCTAVLVRTRTEEKTATGKAVVLWLPAVVVSADVDGGYEVVYEGKLPRWDPFAIVHVPSNHVRPRKPSATTPSPSMPPSSAAGPCYSAATTLTATLKNLETRPAPKPATARNMELKDQTATSTY